MAGEAVVADDVRGESCPTPDVDPVAVIEAALIRLVDDVGVLAEEDVVRAFSILKATDLPSYLRLRNAAKKANRDCSVTVLDKLVRAELPASDDASALDELVALARAQCQLHHDADRNAVAVIPMPDRREVWRVYSSGFEDWLRAAYWRAKEMGVPEATMKSALATLAAAGINDGEEISIHVRAARCDDGYLIDLADEQWQAIHVTPQGWRVVNESPVYFTRTPSMRPLPMPVLVPVDAAVPVDDHHRHITVIRQHAQQGVIGVLVRRGLELVLVVGQYFHVQIDAQWVLPGRRRLQIGGDFLLVGHHRHFRSTGHRFPLDGPMGDGSGVCRLTGGHG